MKYVITTTLLFFALVIGAQSPDMDRMRRDIEVGENILASLLQETYEGLTTHSSGILAGDRSNVEGSYLNGFGVLFTIAPRHLIGSVNWGDGNYSIQHNQAISITIPKEGRSNRQARGRSSGVSGTKDTISLESKFKEVVHNFAADYAYLMRQLPADEKIMIRYGSNKGQSGAWSVIAGMGFSSKNAYSAVIEKVDLDAHQSGRLNRDQLLERIKFTSEEEASSEENRDLILLTNIFSRLYESDLSGNDVFRIRGNPSHEKIEGLGAVVYLSVGSKFSSFTYNYIYNGVRFREGRGGSRVRVVVPDEEGNDEKADVVIDKDVDADDENADKIDDAYPDFMAELEQNIIEYGSIVKDLAKDEALIFKVKFFNCDDCKVMPEKVEITAMQSTLEAYRKGNISLDKAVGQLNISAEK